MSTPPEESEMKALSEGLRALAISLGIVALIVLAAALA